MAQFEKHILSVCHSTCKAAFLDIYFTFKQCRSLLVEVVGRSCTGAMKIQPRKPHTVGHWTGFQNNVSENNWGFQCSPFLWAATYNPKPHCPLSALLNSALHTAHVLFSPRGSVKVRGTNVDIATLLSPLKFPPFWALTKLTSAGLWGRDKQEIIWLDYGSYSYLANFRLDLLKQSSCTIVNFFFFVLKLGHVWCWG